VVELSDSVVDADRACVGVTTIWDTDTNTENAFWTNGRREIAATGPIGPSGALLGQQTATDTAPRNDPLWRVYRIGDGDVFVI